MDHTLQVTYSVLDVFQISGIDFQHYMMLVIIVASYFLIQPMISYFISLQSIRLISYVMSSLFVLFFLCLALLLMDIDHLLLNMIKITFQCLAVFGLGLAIVYSIGRLTKKS